MMYSTNSPQSLPSHFPHLLLCSLHGSAGAGDTEVSNGDYKDGGVNVEALLQTGREIRCRRCIFSPRPHRRCQSTPSTVALTHRWVGVGRAHGARRGRAGWASRGTSGPPSFVVAQRRRSFVFSSLQGRPRPIQ